ALGRPPDPADIAAIEVARESKFGIVGHFDRLLICLEPKQRRQRTKGLFFGDLHLRSNIRQHSWLKECLTKRMSLAAEKHMAAFRNGVLNVFLHFLHGGMIDQRTLLNSRLKAVANFKLRNRGDEFLRKGVINASLDIKPVRADACLTGVT